MYKYCLGDTDQRGAMRAILIILCLLPAICLAGPAKLEAVRYSADVNHTRVVFDLSAPVEHTLFTLSKPDRIVIDITGAHMATAQIPAATGLVRDLRSGTHGRRGLRLVLDLSGDATPRSFLLPANGSDPDRLVVDLYPRGKIAEAPIKVADVAPVSRPRDLIVAIDAGHGGIDPGAHGRHGTLEKNVTLSIARRLAALVKATPGLKPVLIRNGDYYLHLRERILRARQAHADMFISIHADAFRDPRADGSSVYALSEHGASNEAARWLADRENSADRLLGGVKLGDKDDMLASVLLDLSQRATIGASMDVGKQVLRQLGSMGPLHRSKVQQAAFAVLKSPDIPSILVETAFISNPHQERELNTPRYQESLASSILAGVRNYYSNTAPAGTVLAAGHGQAGQTYVIAPGDTLSGIAARYNVTVVSLRAVNGLDDDTIRPGEKLTIPDSTDS